MGKQTKNRYGRAMLCIGTVSLTLSALLGLWLLFTFLPPTPKGTQDVTVPSLIGELYEAHDARLPAELFDLTVEYRTDAVAPTGTILSQSPGGGAVRRIVPGKRRCALHLTVSAGEPTLTLPDLIGRNAETAALQLQQMGLSVLRQKQASTRVAPGQILLTEPLAGTTLHPGDTVTLIESTTKTMRTLRVPSVVGLDEQAALAALQRAGLTPTASLYAPSAEPRGTVISQYPLSDTLVTAGLGATLTLSDGTLPPVTPPEQMPQGDGGASEEMPGSPQNDEITPAVPQNEDENSPPQPSEKKRFNWFGWFS